MSREIKFRAWNESNFNYRMINVEVLGEEFVMGHPVNELEHAGLRAIKWSKSQGASYVLLQYTGLKDKNNNLIFEGDIVESFHYGRTRQVVIIKWSAEKIGFTEFRMHRIGYDEYELHTDISVIGNIYENPELLEEVRHEY